MLHYNCILSIQYTHFFQFPVLSPRQSPCLHILPYKWAFSHKQTQTLFKNELKLDIPLITRKAHSPFVSKESDVTLRPRLS